MRRWNGWGDEGVLLEAPESAVVFIEGKVGPGRPPADASLEQALAAMPASRLGAPAFVDQSPLARLRHSLGESLPDMIAVRAGRLPGYVDGVAWPTSADEVRQALAWAAQAGAAVIPYGGGTSVVGHLDPGGLDRPTLSLDMSRCSALQELDGDGRLAVFGAGAAGPDVEAALRAHGFTLGHFPQSWEYSTLGGWIAARSSGQFSLGYGRIEALFVGGRLETPRGELVLPALPASAAGPDPRQVVLGSEGRLGVITQATVKISPAPQVEDLRGAFFADQGQAVSAARALAQSGLPLTMVRLSLPAETETSLRLAGGGRAMMALRKYLAWRGVGQGMCLMLYGFCGARRLARWVMAEAGRVVARAGGVAVGRRPGRQWLRNRFSLPYLRNNLWAMGYAADTLETATPWRAVEPMARAIEEALAGGLADEGERVHAFTHLSHVYAHGASVYTSYVFRLGQDAERTLARWRKLKAAASRVIVANGGTISHQHGVGLDHKAYLPAEKGPLGLDLLRAQCAAMDPKGMMNPGKLLD